MDSLDLSAILKGAAKGNELYQARRVRDQLCKSDPNCMDYVMIKGHIDKCVQAQKMVAGKVSSLHPAERKEIVAMLIDEKVSWPADVQIALTSSCLKEIVNAPITSKGGGVADAEKQILDMVMPWGFGGEEESGNPQPQWDPTTPWFCTVPVSDETAMAKIWCRFVVTETLVPLVTQGTAKQGLLKAIVIKTRQLLQKVAVKTLRPVMQAAHETVISGVTAVLVLLSPQTPLAELKHLDIVSTARDGVLSHLRQSMLQSPFYRHLQQDLRTREVAQTQFLPLAEEAFRQLKAAAEDREAACGLYLEVLKEACGRDAKTTADELKKLGDTIPLLIGAAENLDEALLAAWPCMRERERRQAGH